jgi:hypothetical protein
VRRTGVRRAVGRDRPHGRSEPVRVGIRGRPARHGHAGRGQVRGLAGAGSESAAGRPELPLQPSDRRLGRIHGHIAACLPDGHRRLPVPVVGQHRQARSQPADQPGRRRNRPGPAACLRRSDGPRRSWLPEADRWLAVRAAGPLRRRANGRRDARRLPVRMADRSAGLPAAVAELPPRRAGQRQLRPRRHPAECRVEPQRHAARQLKVPTRVHGSRRQRLMRHAGVLPDAGQRQGREPRLGQPGRRASAFSQEVTLPSGARRLSIQATDAAGNIGPQASAKVG